MIGRLLEAIAVGIIFPSFQTVLLTITPHSERGRVMGTAGLVMAQPWQSVRLFPVFC